MVEQVKYVELVAVREGTYTTYVFKDFKSHEYIMCAKPPNWQVPEISVGDKGFVNYQVVEAGDEYVTPEGERMVYKYSSIYFLNFVNKTDVLKNKEIIL